MACSCSSHCLQFSHRHCDERSPTILVHDLPHTLTFSTFFSMNLVFTRSEDATAVASSIGLRHRSSRIGKTGWLSSFHLHSRILFESCKSASYRLLPMGHGFLWLAAVSLSDLPSSVESSSIVFFVFGRRADSDGLCCGEHLSIDTEKIERAKIRDQAPSPTSAAFAVS